VVTSGQIGAVPGPDGVPEVVAGGFDAEVRQVLENLAEVLGREGATLGDVVKTTVFLVDMADYAALNAIWIDTFADRRPARSAVAVGALPLGARVEVEAWAYAPET
jgi:2-iminobutanoate/2-iminopropanoate deaminase